jgi:hypothetical protein
MTALARVKLQFFKEFGNANPRHEGSHAPTPVTSARRARVVTFMMQESTIPSNTAVQYFVKWQSKGPELDLALSMA